ncbi:MAG: pyridoxal phosphate-dependent aminotransferase [Deltaproteobacteria bacterium]|nr:pyridoxal phosphate-dependent aminotransferase [Deltaproteobacteria bacterium]
MNINRKLLKLSPSQTLVLNQKAKAIAATGKKVFNFTAGEPDGDTPASIQQAGIEAITSGKTRYTDSAGILELRQEIVAKAQRVYGRTYDVDEVIVSNGGKQAIYNTFYTLLNPEDEVIILTPAWVSYKGMVEMLGAQVVEVSASIEQGFVPSVEAIAAAITENTKLIVLNSPCNPSGAVYSKAFMDELAELLVAHPDIFVLSDDIYEHFVFEGRFQAISQHPKISKERLIIINGVSKSHAMTGWRIGYALANQELVSVMKKIQSQVTSNPCSISQYAALQAIQEEERQENPFRNSFEKRRNLIFGLLSDIPEINVILPQGAFYIFPEVERVLGVSSVAGKIETDIDLCAYLLEEVGVAVVPGSAFGLPGHIRMSYGLSEAAIIEGVALLKEALCKLSKKA